MFLPSSRYAHLDEIYIEDAQGRRIVYKARRFPPMWRGAHMAGLDPVRFHDRPDLMAARNLGNPLSFYRICESNPIMHPMELVAEVDKDTFIPKAGHREDP